MLINILAYPEVNRSALRSESLPMVEAVVYPAYLINCINP